MPFTPSSFVFQSHSPADTQSLARRLAPYLKAGDVVVFVADVGAGKTTFVQGLAQALGAEDDALSPTFIVAQTIDAKIPLHHVDFYRRTPDELLAMGIDDYLTGRGAIPPGIVLIEWADRFPQLWPQERLEIFMGAKKKSTDRDIEMRGVGPRMETIVARLKRAVK